MPEIRLDGQRRLKASSALVIGLGGLGSPVALYLAAAGVGRLGLVDADVVEESNLQRQVLYGTSAAGTPKVEFARARLLDLNPTIQVDVYNESLTPANARDIARGYDLLLDCSDNFPTRYLVNDLSYLLGKPEVFGSVNRFDGQLSVFDARQGPCYRCLFPEPPRPGSGPSYAESAVLGVLPGTIGALQAAEALKLLLGIGTHLVGKLLLFNALDMSFETVTLTKNPGCRLCGGHPEVTDLIDYNLFCGLPGPEQDSAGWEIKPGELAKRIKRGDKLRLLDVREPHELEISTIPGAQNIPLGLLAAHLSELDPNEEIVLFCRTGIRSARALELLASAGFSKARNLRGGINAWVGEVDHSQPVY